MTKEKFIEILRKSNNSLRVKNKKDKHNLKLDLRESFLINNAQFYVKNKHQQISAMSLNSIQFSHLFKFPKSMNCQIIHKQGVFSVLLRRLNVLSLS